MDETARDAPAEDQVEMVDVAEAAQALIERSFISNDALAVIVAAIAALVAAIYAWQQLRQQRIFALERNLDVLQRLNEIALLNEDNLKAAFTSVRDDAPYDPERAREVFFHFLRLNRMYRAWVLWQAWVLKRRDYEQIVNNYASTLKKAEPLFDDLRHRGYSEDFVKDLKLRVAAANLPPLIDLVGSGSGQRPGIQTDARTTQIP